MNKRLAPPYGSWIDRDRAISFRFDGKAHQGFAGDTLSTALWANGVRVLGRSFKYHRPRGIWSLGDSDSNCMVEDERNTNLRGDSLPIADGLDVRAVNTTGAAESDRMRFFEWLAPFMPVGFYYKAFHTPASLFPTYERFIRRAAGLGKVNATNPMIHTPKDYDYCDVLVVGAGPAGLAAAAAAGEAGHTVLVVDRQPYAGGSLWWRHGDQSKLRESLTQRVINTPNMKLRLNTTVASLDTDNWAALVDDTRLTKVRAKSVILATGAYEQPFICRYNDLPGVMLSSAAVKLVHLYGIAPCKAAVVVTANTDGLRAALELHDAGIELRGVVIVRGAHIDPDVVSALQKRKISIHQDKVVYEVLPGPGKKSISGVVVGSAAPPGTPPSLPGTSIVCDGLIMAAGYSPVDELLRQRGGSTRYDKALQQFVPDELPPSVFVAGKANGMYDLSERIRDGETAAEEAVAFLNACAPSTQRPMRPSTPQSAAYPIVHNAEGKAFVDLDEDLQVHDIEQAVHEGFEHAELLKRYSTAGMGPSQGKHGNVAVLRILAQCRGIDIATLAPTTARPYVTPVPMSHLAGRSFTPRRRTAIHAWHEAHGAVFMDAGQWLRPEYYRMGGTSRAACIEAEARNVRTAAGMIDLGTLGKIEVSGPDAVAFLERTYTSRFAKLAVGKVRYAILCDESGVLVDDGIVARLADDWFYLTATTGGAAGVYREMQRNAILWNMNVRVANLTSHVCAISLAGPSADTVLAAVTRGPVNEETYPRVSIRNADVAGAPARVMRVGFVSETGYEIHVPNDAALHVWTALHEAGASHGLKPFGVEAQRLLRLEMGHIIISRDTDALTHPFEVNMDWAIKLDKDEFIGERSLKIIHNKDAERTLVGFTMDASVPDPLPEDCCLVIRNGDITGRVTSIYRSPTLGKPIGLAFVAPDQAQPGARFTIRHHNGAMLEATVTPTPFVHTQGAHP